jgi:hypothetical protein
MLGVQAFTDQLLEQLRQAKQQLQQTSPRLDPAAEWEALQASASPH